MNKKYFWLKLKRDFFKRHDIQIIESMPNGKDYVLFYLKLLVESVDHEGNLRFSDTIPYNEQMLATITNTNIDIVRSAMKIFVELNMVDVLDSGTIFMAEIQKMTGTETYWAEQKRKQRENEPLEVGHCPQIVQSLSNVSNQELDKDKDKDKDKRINTSCRKNKFSDDQMSIAKFFVDKIRVNLPDFKTPNLEQWANDVRMMIDIDGRTEEQIRYLIDWTQKDGFWWKNIMSVAKLRKQYDRLVAEVKSKNEGQKRQPTQNAGLARMKELGGIVTNDGARNGSPAVDFFNDFRKTIDT